MAFGILGNNARNLLYIKKFNNKKAIHLANDKLETKTFLEERGIPFAKTYGVIKNRQELNEFDFKFLPKKNFVIKPNEGSKGKGIYITKYLGSEETNTTENTPQHQTPKLQLRNPKYRFTKKTNISTTENQVQIQGNIISEGQLKRYMIDILDGKYSLSNGNDKILIEEKLIPGELFKDFCEWGLADIRVIVFNLVPVATMIRVPTEKSGGKANLAQGGIGFGIEVGSGKINSMLRKNKIYKTKFPAHYQHFFGKKIPYRNDILFLSSKAQYYTNLGYLALDRVITNDGPKLLEINARAGLEVQKVTDIKLQRRLEKINDVKVQDPEQGVAIAKSLFTNEHFDLIHNKILYLSQYGKLTIKNHNEESPEDKRQIIVEVNIEKNNNSISQHLYDKIKENKANYNIELPESDIIFKKLKLSPTDTGNEEKIILGKKTAEKYLIKPLHKTIETINIINPEKILIQEQQELKTIDQQIEKINKKLNLSARLRPLNYFNELDNFITHHGNYNPIFKYKHLKEDKLQETRIGLEKTLQKLEKIQSPLKQLFIEKIDELQNRFHLIQAYQKQDFENINFYNKKLFGEFDNKLLGIAKEKILNRPKFDHEKTSILGKILKIHEIENNIEKYLAEKKIYDVEIVFTYDNLSRISIITGKEIKISISKSAIFKEQGLIATLKHEIDCHLIRYINGQKSGRNILKSGTAYYLKDEEGFAIRNANQTLPDEYEKLSMYKKYLLSHEIKKMNFTKAADYIKFMYPERTLEGIFKVILRSKKGIINTGENTEIGYLKDKIYLDGYTKINDRISQGNDPEKMYKGKLKIEDLDFIK